MKKLKLIFDLAKQLLQTVKGSEDLTVTVEKHALLSDPLTMRKYYVIIRNGDCEIIRVTGSTPDEVLTKLAETIKTATV